MKRNQKREQDKLYLQNQTGQMMSLQSSDVTSTSKNSLTQVTAESQSGPPSPSLTNYPPLPGQTNTTSPKMNYNAELDLGLMYETDDTGWEDGEGEDDEEYYDENDYEGGDGAANGWWEDVDGKWENYNDNGQGEDGGPNLNVNSSSTSTSIDYSAEQPEDLKTGTKRWSRKTE